MEQECSHTSGGYKFKQLASYHHWLFAPNSSRTAPGTSRHPSSRPEEEIPHYGLDSACFESRPSSPWGHHERHSDSATSPEVTAPICTGGTEFAPSCTDQRDISSLDWQQMVPAVAVSIFAPEELCPRNIKNQSWLGFTTPCMGKNSTVCAQVWVVSGPACIDGASLRAPVCDCGANEQTADHIINVCHIHRPPQGPQGLIEVDASMRDWLLNSGLEIWLYPRFKAYERRRRLKRPPKNRILKDNIVTKRTKKPMKFRCQKLNKSDILNALDYDWQMRWPIRRLPTPSAITYKKLCGHVQPED